MRLPLSLLTLGPAAVLFSLTAVCVAWTPRKGSESATLSRPQIDLSGVPDSQAKTIVQTLNRVYKAEAKYLQAAFPEGNYAPEAVSEANGRLQSTLNVLLERAGKPTKSNNPSTRTALEKKLAEAERRLSKSQRQLQHALAKQDEYAALIRALEQRTSQAQTRAARAAKNAAIAAAAAEAAAEAEVAAVKDDPQGLKPSQGLAKGVKAGEKARTAANLEKLAKAARAELGRKRAESNRNAQRAAKLPQKVADEEAEVAALRQRVAEEDGGGAASAPKPGAGSGGKSGERGRRRTAKSRGNGVDALAAGEPDNAYVGMEASDVVAMRNGRAFSTKGDDRVAEGVGRSGTGALASLKSEDLLRSVRQAGDVAHDKWRAVRTFGPEMLLNSVGLGVGPNRQLQRAPTRVGTPAGFKAAFPIHR